MFQPVFVSVGAVWFPLNRKNGTIHSDRGWNCQGEIKDMEAFKFYILVPVYKTENYIRECLDSILAQTYKNYAAVLVDDGTPDQAGIICDQYALQDTRFHVIHKKNQGLLSARRAAIDYVKENCNQENAYFVFLDSDDYLKPEALQVLVDTILQHDCDVVVYGLQRVFEGKVLSAVDPSPYVGVITDKRELYKRMFSKSLYNPLCRKAIKCNLMQAEDYSRFYHISMGEDLLQSIPVYKRCSKVAFIEDVLYNYTVNPASITQSISFSKYEVDSTVRKEVWDFLETEEVLTQEDKTQYLQFCCNLLEKEVLKIGAFRTENERIKSLLRQIKNDLYYSVLLNIENSSKVLMLLNDEKYDLIIAYAKLRLFLTKIKRKIVR